MPHWIIGAELIFQDYYEKHNLEMKPYQYYLAEFQNVNPEELMENREVRIFTGNRKCPGYDDKCRKIFKELTFGLYIQFHISMI